MTTDVPLSLRQRIRRLVVELNITHMRELILDILEEGVASREKKLGLK